MSLEKIVRPAQSPTNAPAKKTIYRRASSPPTAITIKWGVGGTLKQVSGSFTQNYSLYAVKKPKEQKGKNT